MAKFVITEDGTPVELQPFVTRFHSLWRQRSKVDFEIAGLAAEVRDTFTKGVAGDYQFRQALIDHFDVHGVTAKMLADAARSFRLFPKEEEWHKVSGWRSIRFLSTLTRGDRRKVHRAAVARSVELGRPVGYQVVKEFGFDFGIVERKKKKNSKAVKDASCRCSSMDEVLNHVRQLYADFELPSMPAVVKAALAPKKQSKRRQKSK